MTTKEKAWQLHDTIKEHRYWWNYDEDLLDDLLSKFLDLTDFIWKDDVKETFNWRKNPYLLSVTYTHDLRGLIYKAKRHEDKKEDNLIPILQLYLQQYHLALTFDGNAYIKKLLEGEKPLKIYIILYTNKHIEMRPFAACLSDSKTEIVRKEWIENEKQLAASIKRYDEYLEKYCKADNAYNNRFKEEWKKSKESLLKGKKETFNHYCVYR